MQYNATRFSFSTGVAILFGTILWKLGADVYAPSASSAAHCLQPRTAKLHSAFATPERCQGMAATALTPECSYLLAQGQPADDPERVGLAVPLCHLPGHPERHLRPACHFGGALSDVPRARRRHVGPFPLFLVMLA